MMDEEEEFFWGTPRQSYPLREPNSSKEIKDGTQSPYASQSSPLTELRESKDSKESKESRDLTWKEAVKEAKESPKEREGSDGGDRPTEVGERLEVAGSPPRPPIDHATEERIGIAMLDRLRSLRATDLWGTVSNLPISNLITEQEFKTLKPVPIPTRTPAAPIHSIGPVVTLPPQPRNPHIVNRETPVPPNFAKCVRNKFVFRAFRDFLDKQQASENIRAWQEIEEWRVMKPDPPLDIKRAKELMKKYFVVGALHEVNIPYDIRTDMQAELRSAKINFTPLTSHFFDNAARESLPSPDVEIEWTLADELCPQFLKSAAYKQLKSPAT